MPKLFTTIAPKQRRLFSSSTLSKKEYGDQTSESSISRSSSKCFQVEIDIGHREWISHPRVSDFARHLHKEFGLASICDGIDIWVGDKYINPLQSTYYLEDNAVLTVCCNDETIVGLSAAKKKQKSLVEDNNFFPSVLVTIDTVYEDALLKQSLKEERITVNALECPRVKDIELLLMKQLRILEICPEAQGLNLRIGSYSLSGEDTTHVMRDGDTLMISINKKDQTPTSKRLDRKRKRQRILEVSIYLTDYKTKKNVIQIALNKLG